MGIAKTLVGLCYCSISCCTANLSKIFLHCWPSTNGGNTWVDQVIRKGTGIPLFTSYDSRSRIGIAIRKGCQSTLREFYRTTRSEEHTSELQSPDHLVCRLLLEKKKKK